MYNGHVRPTFHPSTALYSAFSKDYTVLNFEIFFKILKGDLKMAILAMVPILYLNSCKFVHMNALTQKTPI